MYPSSEVCCLRFHIAKNDHEKLAVSILKVIDQQVLWCKHFPRDASISCGQIVKLAKPSVMTTLNRSFLNVLKAPTLGSKQCIVVARRHTRTRTRRECLCLSHEFMNVRLQVPCQVTNQANMVVRPQTVLFDPRSNPCKRVRLHWKVPKSVQALLAWQVVSLSHDLPVEMIDVDEDADSTDSGSSSSED